MPVLPSYKNQSIDLLCKSIDWFLPEDRTGTQWVNEKLTLKVEQKFRHGIAREEKLLNLFFMKIVKQIINRKKLCKETQWSCEK